MMGAATGWRGARRVAFTVVSAAVLAACVAKRDTYEVPDVPMPADLRNQAAAEPAVPTFAATAEALNEVLPHWWTAFGNAELNGLVERALDANMDLRMAVARVVQARSSLRGVEADGWPVLTASLQTGQESPSNGIGSVPAGGTPQSQHTYQAGLRLQWMPDLWGEYAAADESAASRLRAAIHARDAARAQVIADVVRTYLQYLSLQDRLTTAREVTRTMGVTLDRLQQQLDARDATALRVAQQRATTYASTAAIPDLQLQAERTFGQLALLVGTVPADLTLTGVSLQEVSVPAVPATLPPQFVLRRPQVRQAEAQLLAADADIDVARARVLPPLSLGAGIGWGNTVFSRMFRPESLMWDIAAELVATLFDAGKRDSAVEQSRARYEELSFGYVQAVYDAVREVDAAMAAQVYLTRRTAAQETAVEAASTAYSLSQDSFDLGAVDYLTLLDAERTFLRNQDDFYQIRLARLQSVADLMEALGGGADYVPDEALDALEAAPLAEPASAPAAVPAPETAPASE